MKRSAILTALTAAAIPLSVAQADALLFPYVVTSSTVATIISVVNKDPDGELFLNYFTKNSLANTASCTNQLRHDVDSAQNDLVSFEANGSFVGGVASALGGPLFNDPAGDADYGGDNFTMGPISGATRAFLIVDDNDNNGEDLYGEAILLETQGGAAWGYRAYNAASDFGQTGVNFPEFDAVANGGGIASPTNDNLGEVLDDQNNTDTAAVTLLPTDEWETRFFVTPISAGDQRCTDCNAAIKLTRNVSEASTGLFDRDSNPLSGSNTVEVICVSGVSLQELLPTSAQATVAAQGGWGFINVDPGTAGGTSAPAAVVLKLEFNSAQFISPDASNSFVGTVNTAVWLRNRDNTEGVSGL
ncbi:MAG: hypothetical protein H6970_01055 [Gammaproteobacteria bacterium]|nr:hypothetical protein [Gammaproteobacteria bacterium]MCP5459899.1 hypothetical protein [Gammaproteobacteria bacterium]